MNRFRIRRLTRVERRRIDRRAAPPLRQHEHVARGREHEAELREAISQRGGEPIGLFERVRSYVSSANLEKARIYYATANSAGLSLGLDREDDGFGVADGKVLEVDVRVIAATNTDLEQRVQEGQFRKDLYFRLQTHRVEIPPLRERLDDMPLLVDHFVDRLNALKNKSIDGVSCHLCSLCDFVGVYQLELILFWKG